MSNSISERHTREANQQMTSSNSKSSEIGNNLNQYKITNIENLGLIEKKSLKLDRVNGESFNTQYLYFDLNSAMEVLFKKSTRLQKEDKLYFKEKSIKGRGEFYLSLLTSKKLLIDNMKILASKGVTVLYLEHLFFDLHQEYLD
ncbi:hypothetical protein [Candidatus Williamhamiltonella defendens]|uniref:hypothetical protein n=1 Tax=Candidatus Williamhamiltonella defendens TaxID=138072 RepID=UPI00130DB00E|nr:hypothetical protein [Candidatus Hamiltonella defensa]